MNNSDAAAGLADALRSGWAILREHRRLILAVTAAGTLLTAIAAIVPPRQYTAEALVGVGGAPAGADAEQSIDASSVETQLAMLNSEAHLHQVISKLSAAATDPIERKGAAPTLIQLKGSLKIFQAQRSRVIVVQYSDPVPERAARIANAVAYVHIDTLREAMRRDGRSLLDYLNKQIEDIGAEVEKSTKIAQSYRVAHGLNDQSAIEVQAVSDVDQQLSLARIDEARRQSIMQQIRDLQNASGGPNVAAMAKLIGYQPAERQNDPSEKFSPDEVFAINSAVNQFREETGLVRAQIQQLESHLRNLRSALTEKMDQKARLGLLERQASSADKLFENLLERRQRTLERVALSSVDIRVLTSAAAPALPSSKGPLFWILPAMVAFFGLGCASALTRERLGGGLWSERQAQEELGIASFELGATAKGDAEKKQIASSDSMQSLALAALQPGEGIKSVNVVLITSTEDNEGKAEIAAAFADCAIAFGRKVALIEADPLDRAPHTAQFAHFNAGAPPVAPDNEAAAPAFQRIDPAAVGIGDAFDAEKYKSALKALETFDCVVVNAPPLRNSSTTLAMAAAADSIILALAKRRTTRDAARRSVKLLQSAIALNHSSARVYGALAASAVGGVPPTQFVREAANFNAAYASGALKSRAIAAKRVALVALLGLSAWIAFGARNDATMEPKVADADSVNSDSSDKIH